MIFTDHASEETICHSTLRPPEKDSHGKVLEDPVKKSPNMSKKIVLPYHRYGNIIKKTRS